jgi:7-cyano-7-deazaguanine synthase in queuosine biosynthesis
MPFTSSNCYICFILINLKKYEVIHAITFIYGQKHQREIEFAKTIAQRFYNLEHILVGLISLKTILRSVNSGFQSSITTLDKSIFGAGNLNFISSSDLTIMLAIAKFLNHFVLAGIIYHGAHEVLHRLIASSYAIIY